MQHIPLDLMVAMRDRYGLKRFVETGTYRGKTTLLALAYFDIVTTCEISQALHDMLALRLPKVEPPKELIYLRMESPKMLKFIFDKPDQIPCLVWLDAHWCGGPKLGPECPLLAELRAINGTRGRHVILIDDARMFLNPPPPPHDPKQWPTFGQIKELCRQLGPTDVVEVFGDVIVVRPKEENPKCKT